MLHRKALTVSAIALLIGTIATAPSVTAHNGATGIVKERMELMKGIGDQMKVMGAMAKGKRPYEQSAFVEGAQTALDGAPKITSMFPEGSLSEKSEALPSIWEKWAEFEQSAKDLETESAKLLEVASGDADQKAVLAQFVKMGKTCRGCHQDFREKKEK
jgi:cytochrome c556